jgi:hypothetical protein
MEIGENFGRAADPMGAGVKLKDGASKRGERPAVSNLA